jgi:transposase InsO family protein
MLDVVVAAADSLTLDDLGLMTELDLPSRSGLWLLPRPLLAKTPNGNLSDDRALWRDTCTELGITPKKTRPYRPQTNGKIERFRRTLADGWAFNQLYPTEQARRAALPAWLHHYNHHRPHTAIGKVPPITRLTNLAGQYI